MPIVTQKSCDVFRDREWYYAFDPDLDDEEVGGGNSPEEAARDYCDRHNLPYDLIPPEEEERKKDKKHSKAECTDAECPFHTTGLSRRVLEKEKDR